MRWSDIIKEKQTTWRRHLALLHPSACKQLDCPTASSNGYSRDGDVRLKRKRKQGEVKGRREESKADSGSGQTKLDRKEMGAEWTEHNRQGGKKKGREEKKPFVRAKFDRSMIINLPESSMCPQPSLLCPSSCCPFRFFLRLSYPDSPLQRHSYPAQGQLPLTNSNQT